VKFCFLFFFILLGLKVLGQGDSSKPAIDTSKNILRNVQHNSNWKIFEQKVHRLKMDTNEKVTIVHIGDSHIQGGYFTNRMRTLLNNYYGISGRGLVFPYSLAYTNGPEDVKFYSNVMWTGQKYSYKHGEGKTGLTGYNLWMNNATADLLIILKQGSDTLYPFNEIVIYHNTPSLQVRTNPDFRKTTTTGEGNFYSTKLIFNTTLDSMRLNISVSDTTKLRPAIYGIELLNNKPGIVYHVAGSNGSTYESFSRAIDYIPMLKTMHPDCIIISLGTNEAYMTNVDTMQLKSRIVTMIENIKKEIPKVCILLTTPGDHLRGKKFPNPNLIKVRATIIAAAIEEKCVFWDFFEVMGGLYSSKNWSKHGLMFKDILHLSKEGYKFQGELFFDAFNRAVKE
jgi:lysophospholipase L1-like esterase